jgi:acid phosphatase
MSISSRWRQSLLASLVGLVAGVGLATTLPSSARTLPQAPAAFKPEVPAQRGLDANLYMQTAAEYRACCLQAYNLATRRVKELYESSKDNGKPLAVVTDLDETVFDNAGFQAMMLRSDLAYDQRMWDQWEEKNADQVGLIPGAKDFLKEVDRLNVTVFYISNRNEKYRPGTLSALQRLGLPFTDAKQLKLATTTSDKTARRKEVEAEYKVLLYLGDNLRDFDEQFRCTVDNTREDKRTTDPARLAVAIKERKDKVDQTRDKWGREWIIFPNPAYGEWMKALGLGTKDLDRLVPPIQKAP